MWQSRKSSLLSLPAPLVLGLFAGRLLSEQWALNYGASWFAAILLTVAITLLALFCLRHHPLRQTWPLLLLGSYVLYPHPNPSTAVAAALLVTAVLVQTHTHPRNNFATQPTPARWRCGQHADVCLALHFHPGPRSAARRQW
jgi:hypothetical protein